VNFLYDTCCHHGNLIFRSGVQARVPGTLFYVRDNDQGRRHRPGDRTNRKPQAGFDEKAGMATFRRRDAGGCTEEGDVEHRAHLSAVRRDAKPDKAIRRATFE
jgi:hypothetical protein